MKKNFVSTLLVLMLLVTQMSVFAEDKSTGRNIAKYLSFQGSEDFLKSVEITVRQNGKVIEIEDGDDIKSAMSLDLNFIWDLNEKHLAQLEDELKAYDYLSFQLPATVRVKENQTYTIFNEHKEASMQIIADKNGWIRIECLKDAQDYDILPFKGDVQIRADFNHDQLPEGGPVELLFPIKEQGSFQIHLVLEKAHDKPYKQVNTDLSDSSFQSPKKITWEIVLNEDYRHLINIEIEKNSPIYSN